MRSESSPPDAPAHRRPLRILIVDDHPLVRRGLIALIDSEPDLTVCASVAGHREGLEAIASTRPDLVIADLSLGEGDGFGLIRDIRSRDADLPVLVLTLHEAPQYARRAFRAGASGYLSKQEMTGTILVAIRRVIGGERYVRPKIGQVLDTI